MACRPALVWGGILAAGVVAEAHALVCHHHDCTFSALTRDVFRTDSLTGRVTFVAGSALLALWFEYHILTWKRELEADSSQPKIAPGQAVACSVIVGRF